MAEGSEQDPWRAEQSEVVKQLRKSTGHTVRSLADRTSRKAQSWSAYEGTRPIPPEVLKELIDLASSAPAQLKQRAHALLDHITSAAASADSAAAGPDVPESHEACPESALADQLAPAPPTVPKPPVWARKKGRAVACTVLAAVCLLGGLAASQDASSCQPHSQYKVTKRGNVVDENDTVVGEVAVDDRFTRDESPGIADNPYRYHGTAERSGVTGYVLQENLTYYRTLCT
jgi:hypothetical protein